MKKNVLKALALSVLATVSVFAADAVTVPLKQNPDFSIDCKTGEVYDVFQRKQDFTFACGTVTSQPDVRTGKVTVTNLNPLEYATVETAEKAMAFIKKIAPNATVQPFQLAPYGPFSFSLVQRFVSVNGNLHNAGMIVSSLMWDSETRVKERLLAEFATEAKVKDQ